MILIDTNVISELMRPAPSGAVLGWFAARSSTELFLCAVGEAELRTGAAILSEGRRRDSLTALIDAVIEVDFAGRILVFDSAAAKAYARIAALRRRDSLTALIDAVIEVDFAGRILVFDSAAAKAYARIAALRRAAGRPIMEADCQIAAIASVHGAIVATRNIADFVGCGVDIIDPWQGSGA
ncbi:type II toxin-antitoxin system VapC family toxin [Amaricoccus sp. W119]|uniref:type II toxin-antitoxin system VapC family toxin n=1 Tax=Amaricoccus sp. W119 TaxID=3391833 RepID=UPI0039A4B713